MYACRNTAYRKGSVTDYDKPLSVAAGSDSFAAIDLRFGRDRPAATLDAIRQIYCTRFPQREREYEAGIDDPTNDPNFNEPVVDRMQSQREQVGCIEISVGMFVVESVVIV